MQLAMRGDTVQPSLTHPNGGEAGPARRRQSVCRPASMHAYAALGRFRDSLRSEENSLVNTHSGDTNSQRAHLNARRRDPRRNAWTCARVPAAGSDAMAQGRALDDVAA